MKNNYNVGDKFIFISTHTTFGNNYTHGKIYSIVRIESGLIKSSYYVVNDNEKEDNWDIFVGIEQGYIKYYDDEPEESNMEEWYE